jgi:hypothetical protein
MFFELLILLLLLLNKLLAVKNKFCKVLLQWMIDDGCIDHERMMEIVVDTDGCTDIGL